MVVINPLDGKVEMAKAFDTHELCGEFDTFMTKGVEEDYIVAVACKDDCISEIGLSDKII